MHNQYARKITDLPEFQYKTVSILTILKFRCQNERCNRKVFREQHSHITSYCRQTARANSLLSNIAIEMKSGTGHKLSESMKVKASRSTLTRLSHRQLPPMAKDLKVVGVDDWAFRKGVNYRTVLVDMKTSKPTELFPTREGEDLKAWLKEYLDI